MDTAAEHIKAKYRAAERLLHGPATASEIAKDTGLARTAVWHHLVALTGEGFVERKYDEKGDSYLYRTAVNGC